MSKDLQALNDQNITGNVGWTEFGVLQQRSECQVLVQGEWCMRADLLQIAETVIRNRVITVF